MTLLKNNIDLECYLVTKHSWKGKYKRIFSIGCYGISTYNPDKFDLTNRWAYSDVVAAVPNKVSSIPNEFQLTIKKDRKLETIKLSSEYRNDILSSILKNYKEFADKPKSVERFQAYKFHWSGISLPTVLEVTPCSLDQLDPTSNEILASYMYKDIEGIIAGIADYEGGIVMACGGFSRLHLFKALNHHEIVQSITHKAAQFLSIDIKILKSQITLDQFERQRFGKYCGDEYQTSTTEFTVQKITSRHPEPVKRLLCLTETTILERDPQTYSVCTLRPLIDIYALVRDKDNIQKFHIEYKNGVVRKYITNDRDSLLATILDAVRSSGNQDIHVRITSTPRGKRIVPLAHTVDEESEANLMRLVINNFQNQTKRGEILERFNANISYSGLKYSVTQDSLFAENKEKLILSTLQALSQKEVDNPTAQLSNLELEATFHCLRRLLATKVGYAAFTNLPGFREIIGIKVVRSLERNDLAVTYAAIDMINTLLHSINADHDLKQEQLNKSSILSSQSFLETLLNMWTNHVNHGTGALVLSAMLDFLTFALCVPYSETTDGKQFDILLGMIADRGRCLYKLFQHPSLAIVKGAGLVLRAIIEEGETEVTKQMQSLALDEAALCRHLLVSLYTPSNDPTLTIHRQLSRHLIGLWITDNIEAMELLKRIFPAGLLMFLESKDVEDYDVDEDKLNFRDNLKFAIQHSTKNKMNVIGKRLEDIKHWGLKLIDYQENIKEAIKNRPVVLRNRRQKKKETDDIINLPYFFYNFNKDHSLPNLIWNHKTREELKMCLENELRQFMADRELAGITIVAWNYQEFEVQYQCLADEIKIGDYYVRLILEKDDWPQNLVKDPIELFNALYRRVLCRNRINDDQLTVTSLQALGKVYKRYHEDIGKFSDMSYILQLLDRALSPSLRDALIGFINCLVLEKSNCRPFVDSVQCLVDLITLAHLHKGRAIPNTKTNVIEAGPNMENYEEKDWYYNIEKDSGKPERQGPVTYTQIKELWHKNVINPKTRCWAVGMDGWRSLQQIPQLKWCLMAKGTPIYNESELASHILDILIKCTSYFPSRTQNGTAILIPGPKLSRKLSEFILLPHIVQVCLTHDPGLLERVATLLSQIMEDNQEMPKVYLTGVFYFMLMYTGSNILPITKFLKMTHMKQGFRSEESSESGIMHRSILGHLLPEAMVCFLENYTAEKFAEIFLGEFDTPEVIWNSEMRRLLIEKISAHIADFTPRLRGHTMARYPYLAIPAISYPQLENELFCHIYYLRHLCDTQKFPNWPISDPVQLLKHTLEAWRKEVDKKPPSMTINEAYEDLGIDLTKNSKPDESTIRKSYYRLAQIYHPDKNPNGREMFEKVNQAYEFLCSRSSWNSGGPDPSNIVLILQTQSILFERYSEVLQPYKYAGYPQLIKTIRLETKDVQLFAKNIPLLAAASELCYHTVKCSALNAEELRREEGIEALLEAFSRCVSIMGVDSKPEDLHYQVISNITKCFEVACNFENCKKKIIELPQLISDVCRVAYFKHAISVSLVTNLAANNYDLQCNLVKNGILWSLLLFCFEFDYTLDESGVEVNEKSNKQQVSNNLAKMSILSCIALCGYNLEIIKKNSTTITNPVSNHITPMKSSRPAPGLPSSAITSSSYTQNAKNLIQNSKQLVHSLSNDNVPTTKSDFSTEKRNSLRNRSEMIDTTATPALQIEKVNIINNQQFIVSGEPKNVLVKQIIDKLFTSHISDKIATEPESEVLKILTSNTRNPYIIWDNGTRTQLIEFLENQRNNSTREVFDDITSVYESVSSFEYDAHINELKLGGVFIRIYNEMPTFPINNPKSFALDILEYLKQSFRFLSKISIQKSQNVVGGDGILMPTLASNHPQYSDDNNMVNKKTIDDVLNAYNRSKTRTKIENYSENNKIEYDFDNNENIEQHTILVFRALLSVIKSNADVEMQCIGHFDMIFGFLANSKSIESSLIKQLALEVIALVSRNKDCVIEIAACEILGSFLVALKDSDIRNNQIRVLETLSGLMNVQEMIKEAQNKGAVIYLLDLFCNSTNPQIREMCAEILSKMTADRLSGPKIRITICKFLPSLFVDAMIESPQASVQLYDSIHEHPELIWNDKTRNKVSNAVTDMCTGFCNTQKLNNKILWKDPEILKDIITNEVVVAGVYLRLFISNPAWTLRKPKQFLSELLDFIVEQISKNSSAKTEIDLSTTSLIELLRAQPNLADEIPVLGHIPKLINLLSVKPKCTLSVISQLSLSELCVGQITHTECILPLIKCMDYHKELTETACETLSRLFKYQHDSLICQSLDANLIPFLLNLLENRLEYLDNPSTVKAQIVAALKAMTHNLNYGDKVSQILLKHPIWSEFKDQRHDLFVMDSNVRGYLTGTNPTAGYLTQGPSQNVEVLTSPPPIDRDDPLARQTE